MSHSSTGHVPFKLHPTPPLPPLAAAAPDYVHNKAHYLYYHCYSMRRLFALLEDAGFEAVAHRRGLLTHKLLAAFDVLFVNLIHENDPHFSPAEIDAVQEWVHNGGGLFCIAEHTNTYHSSEKLNPLLAPLGVKVQWTTALDAPEHCTNAPGWLLVRNVDRAHAVCAGVTTLHFLSCASLERLSVDARGRAPRVAFVARTSEHGWADRAGHLPPSFYGDGRRSADDEQGAMPVAACVQYGAGRCVVLGDQNAVGDAMLHFRHNRRFALNCFEWVVSGGGGDARRQRAAAAGCALDFNLVPGGTRVGIDLSFSGMAAAKEGDRGLVGFYMNMNRCAPISGEAVAVGERLLAGGSSGGGGGGGHHEVAALFDDDATPTLDALLIPAPVTSVPAAVVASLRAMARAGRTLVLLLDHEALAASVAAAQHALDLLAALAPSFRFEFDDAVAAGSSASSAASTTTSIHVDERSALRERMRCVRKWRVRAGPVRLVTDADADAEADADADAQSNVNRAHTSTIAPAIELAHVHLQDVSLPLVRSSWGRALIRSAPHAHNVALACAAYQSSACEDVARAQPATAATDGDWLTHSHTGLNDRRAWLLVDLGRAVELERVVLYNRAELSGLRFRDLCVQLFADASDGDGAGAGAGAGVDANAERRRGDVPPLLRLCAALGCARGECEMVCAQCGAVRYCDRACQRAHWPHHRAQCKSSQASAASLPVSAAAAASSMTTHPPLGALVFATPLLNAGDVLRSPTHLTVELSPPVRARFIRVSRVACEDATMHPEDQCILSVAQVVAVASMRAAANSAPATSASSTASASATPSASVASATRVPAHVPLLIDAALACFGASASQSSIEGDHPAACALDGRADTFTHTRSDDARAWLRIDLGRERRVRLVRLVNRADGWCARLRDVTVELRDATDALVYESELLNAGNRAQAPPQVCAHTGGVAVRARYVTVRRLTAALNEALLGSGGGGVLGGDAGDTNVLSLARVCVMCEADSDVDAAPPPEPERFDVARIGRVHDDDHDACAGSRVDNGDNLIVFLQHHFWHNAVISSVCDRRSCTRGEMATRLEYALLEYLHARAEQRKGNQIV